MPSGMLSFTQISAAASSVSFIRPPLSSVKYALPPDINRSER
jgi:hypothetical protein